VYFETIIID